MEETRLRRVIQEEIEKDKRKAQFSVSRVPYHVHNNLDAPKLHLLELGDMPSSYSGKEGEILMVNSTESGMEFMPGYFMVSKDTNGTTNVDVFGTAGAPFDFTVTGVFLISKDTTAGNITVLQAANTVCTIAKGTTAGAMVGATSLANTAYTKGDVCQVDSSTTGNATVFITFVT